jgi:hypothetical protein
MFTADFWRRAVERAIKSAAQGLVAAIPVAAVGDMATLEAAAVLAPGLFVLSILTSLASASIGPDKGDPSVVA